MIAAIRTWWKTINTTDTTIAYHGRLVVFLAIGFTYSAAWHTIAWIAGPGATWVPPAAYGSAITAIPMLIALTRWSWYGRRRRE